MYAIFMFRQKEDDHLEMDVAREKRYSLHMHGTLQ